MKLLITVILILITSTSVALGQGKAEVARVDELVSSQLKARLPDWSYKSVEAFQPSSTIVVQKWTWTNRGVMVRLAIHDTDEDAKKEIKSFLQFRPEHETLHGFGDDAYITERNGSSVIMRRGRFVIYINMIVNIEHDPDSQTLSKVEMEARRKAEVQRIAREFAQQLSAIELH